MSMKHETTLHELDIQRAPRQCAQRHLNTTTQWCLNITASAAPVPTWSESQHLPKGPSQPSRATGYFQPVG